MHIKKIKKCNPKVRYLKFTSNKKIYEEFFAKLETFEETWLELIGHVGFT